MSDLGEADFAVLGMGERIGPARAVYGKHDWVFMVGGDARRPLGVVAGSRLWSLGDTVTVQTAVSKLDRSEIQVMGAEEPDEAAGQDFGEVARRLLNAARRTGAKAAFFDPYTILPPPDPLPPRPKSR
jgi:hypothetical protein